MTNGSAASSTGRTWLDAALGTGRGVHRVIADSERLRRPGRRADLPAEVDLPELVRCGKSTAGLQVLQAGHRYAGELARRQAGVPVQVSLAVLGPRPPWPQGRTPRQCPRPVTPGGLRCRSGSWPFVQGDGRSETGAAWRSAMPEPRIKVRRLPLIRAFTRSRRSSSPTLVNDRVFAARPVWDASYEQREIGVDSRYQTPLPPG
jgi:hypothetical protein